MTVELNIKELEGKPRLYLEDVTIIKKSVKSSKKHYVFVSDMRFFLIKEKAFSRLGISLSRSLLQLSELVINKADDNFYLTLTFMHGEDLDERKILFKTIEKVEELSNVLLERIDFLQQLDRRFEPLVELNNIVEKPPSEEFNPRSKRMGKYYEILCDLYDKSYKEKIRNGFENMDGDTLYLKKIIDHENTKTLMISNRDLFLISKTLHGTKDSYKHIECDDAVIQDLGFYIFLKKILNDENIESIKMTNCFINSGNALVSFSKFMNDHNPHLKILDFSNNPKVGDSGMGHLSKALGKTSLETLRLSNCGITHKGINHLSISLCSVHILSSLKKLDISFNYLKTSGTEFIAKYISRTTNLEELNLNHTETSLEIIVDAILKNPNDLAVKKLKCLDLSNCKVDDSGIDVLCDYLSKTEALQVLKLRNCHIEVKILYKIFKALSQNPAASLSKDSEDLRPNYKLRLCLDVSDNKFDDPVKFQGETCHAIRELNINNCFTRVKDFISVLGDLKALKKLHTLRISKNVRISRFGESPKGLSEVLIDLSHSLPSLSYIEIEGMPEIFCLKSSLNDFFSWLPCNKTLKRLDLCYNKLEDADFKVLGEALKKNTYLRILNVDYNKSGAKGMISYLEAIKTSENLVSNLPTTDIEALSKTKNADILLKMKLLVDEVKNRFKSNKGNIDENEKLEYEHNFKYFDGYEPLMNEKYLEVQRGKQFGVSYKDLYGTKRIERFKSPIPVILLKMEEYFFKKKANLEKGIFRLAPNKRECEKVKDELDRNTFVECNDIHCISNCLKMWFRLLPERLFSEKIIKEAQKRSQLEDNGADNSQVNYVEELIYQNLKEPQLSLLLWLLNFTATVAKDQDVSMMSSRNLAIVFAPNLLPHDLNTQAELAVNLLDDLIRWWGKSQLKNG